MLNAWSWSSNLQQSDVFQQVMEKPVGVIAVSWSASAAKCPSSCCLFIQGDRTAEWDDKTCGSRKRQGAHLPVTITCKIDYLVKINLLSFQMDLSREKQTNKPTRKKQLNQNKKQPCFSSHHHFFQVSALLLHSDLLYLAPLSCASWWG